MKIIFTNVIFVLYMNIKLDFVKLFIYKQNVSNYPYYIKDIVLIFVKTLTLVPPVLDMLLARSSLSSRLVGFVC